jgi:chorismate dehydratase
VLVQILLDEMYGVRPQLLELPLGASAADIEADAVVVIGDRAIREHVDESLRDTEFEFRRNSATVWDLGEQWNRWTGLPFVFAAWAARPGVEIGDVEGALAAARDRGAADVEAIARRQSAVLGLPLELVRTYLRNNLHFTLGAEERRGLGLFFEKALALGLIDDIGVASSRFPSPALRREGAGGESIGQRGRLGGPRRDKVGR